MDAGTHTLKNLDEMEREAATFIEQLQPESSRATLVTLSGELGAGKTTFTQFIAKALGITDTVNSPTFVIEKIYATTSSEKWSRLIHIDAYRLKDMKDLDVLGFEEVMNHAGTLILLEWPEQVAGISEKASVKIKLEVAGEGRTITYA